MVLVNCKWDEWVYGDCSKSCGGGVRIKTRVKVAQEEYGGICEGEPSAKEPCNNQNCPGKYQIGIFNYLCE